MSDIEGNEDPMHPRHGPVTIEDDQEPVSKPVNAPADDYRPFAAPRGQVKIEGVSSGSPSSGGFVAYTTQTPAEKMAELAEAHRREKQAAATMAAFTARPNELQASDAQKPFPVQVREAEEEFKRHSVQLSQLQRKADLAASETMEKARKEADHKRSAILEEGDAPALRAAISLAEDRIKMLRRAQEELDTYRRVAEA